MSKHTPGPWRWEVNETCKRVHLCGGAVPYDLTILQPTRWGMHSASFMLRDPALDGYQLLHPMQNWLATVPGREHHASWFKTIEHPDASLIAAAPDLLAALTAVMDEWRDGYGLNCVEQVRAAIAKAEGR